MCSKHTHDYPANCSKEQYLLHFQRHREYAYQLYVRNFEILEVMETLPLLNIVHYIKNHNPLALNSIQND